MEDKLSISGRTEIFVDIQVSENSFNRSAESLEVTVLRPVRLVDTLFSVTIVFLLAILFINFGAAIDVKIIKEIFRRPVGPAIGTTCQLVFMPLLAFGLGWALFPNDHELALGLFLCGIAPAGGASNIWALLLGGNINLSISMTTISTILCFGSMPFWLFALGRIIFERANLGVPYLQVTLVAASLLIPLGIGLLIQKFLPRVAKFLVWILKPLSLLFIIIVVIFGLLTNLYMLQLFAWQVRAELHFCLENQNKNFIEYSRLSLQVWVFRYLVMPSAMSLENYSDNQAQMLLHFPSKLASKTQG